VRGPLLLLVALLPLAGCPEPREAGPLVDHASWTTDAVDPWPDHAPDVVDCSALSWSDETTGGEPSLEVRTDSCNYLVVGQGSIREALEGDDLQVRLWHYDLVQFEPATAHAALQVAGLTVFEAEIPIPSSAEMVVQDFALDRDLPEGSPVVFHLHNHGANTWNLVEVSVNPPGSEAQE
jgi:hypothetical protein